ncbi:MAG: threonine synthase [Rhodospirillales bacterium]
MNYLSTRGQAPILGFDDVVLAGLARDGGLYVPESWPTLDPAGFAALSRLSYAELAAHVMAPFAAPHIPEAELAMLCDDAYRDFDAHPDPAPLRPLADGVHLLELFHGPTLAFKDYALQVLGRLFDLILARRGERITIIGATSGDTGSAAIEACRDRDTLDIFMLHPQGRVSEVQRRQMTTVRADNVHNIAIDGTFDDCQNLVKALFVDQTFRDRFRLAAVNSINWARIAAQIVYYVHAALALGGGRKLAFVVPTGNFGNVFAAYGALRMGVPIDALVVASNRNDILTRFFESGMMETGTVYPTLSPSMDIQISSNFERYLFELLGRDAAAVTATMQHFRERGAFAVDADKLQQARGTFVAARCDDPGTAAVIREVYQRDGILVDPHTAVGIAAAAAADLPSGVEKVCIATAHPAKFPDAVEAATGVRPALPERLAGLMSLPERCSSLPADAGALARAIAETLQQRGVMV